jgi:hypothetical protein
MTSSVGRWQTGGIITGRVLQRYIVVAALKRLFVKWCSRIKGYLIDRKKARRCFVDRGRDMVNDRRWVVRSIVDVELSLFDFLKDENVSFFKSNV